MREGGRRVSGPGIRSRFRGVAGEEQPTALPWVDDGSAIVPFSRMTVVVQAGCPLTGQQIGPFLNSRFSEFALIDPFPLGVGWFGPGS